MVRSASGGRRYVDRVGLIKPRVNPRARMKRRVYLIGDEPQIPSAWVELPYSMAFAWFSPGGMRVCASRATPTNTAENLAPELPILVNYDVTDEFTSTSPQATVLASNGTANPDPANQGFNEDRDYFYNGEIWSYRGNRWKRFTDPWGPAAALTDEYPALSATNKVFINTQMRGYDTRPNVDSAGAAYIGFGGTSGDWEAQKLDFVTLDAEGPTATQRSLGPVYHSALLDAGRYFAAFNHANGNVGWTASETGQIFIADANDEHFLVGVIFPNIAALVSAGGDVKTWLYGPAANPRPYVDRIPFEASSPGPRRRRVVGAGGFFMGLGKTLNSSGVAHEFGVYLIPWHAGPGPPNPNYTGRALLGTPSWDLDKVRFATVDDDRTIMFVDETNRFSAYLIDHTVISAPDVTLLQTVSKHGSFSGSYTVGDVVWREDTVDPAYNALLVYCCGNASSVNGAATAGDLLFIWRGLEV